MTLSIITINYNNRDGLQKTIDSVLAQTWTDFEWLVIDGGSTDGSKELIEQYQKHFAYWCSEPDKGVYHAINKGIAKATGQYVNFMNSGDTYYDAETLKNVFLIKRNAGVLYGDWVIKKIDKEEPDSVSEQELMETLWSRNLCHQAMFFRSDLLKSKNYDESMKLLADWKRNTELLLEGEHFLHIKLFVCKFDAYGMSGIRNHVYFEEQKRVISLYPQYMQRAIKELDEFRNNRHIQMTREALSGNKLIANALKIFIRLFFYSMLLFKKIHNIFS